jgi:hypothetical protein
MNDKAIPVCFGYQGKGNIGDNLMFILNTAPFEGVCVLKGRKVRDSDIELPMLPYGLKILTADEMIFSGGNIFNVDHWRSHAKIVSFYLLVRIRRLLGKKTSFLSVGINTNTTSYIQRLAIRTVLMSDHAHLRETSIKVTDLWARMRHRQDVVRFGPDIVYTGDLGEIEASDLYQETARSVSGERFAVFFPSILARREAERHTPGQTEEVTLPDDIEKVYVIVQDEEDAFIRPEFFTGRKIIHISSHIGNIAQILALVVGARLVVTERYHGAILAKRFGVPMVAANYSEKLRHIEMVS